MFSNTIAKMLIIDLSNAFPLSQQVLRSFKFDLFNKILQINCYVTFFFLHKKYASLCVFKKKSIIVIRGNELKFVQFYRPVQLNQFEFYHVKFLKTMKTIEFPTTNG